MNGKKWYQNGFRRILLDMHIPDWDKKFLSKYNPKKMVELYKKAGLSSAMFYSQSHLGLCYWPTKTGKMHGGLKGKDNIAINLKELEKAGMGSCVYYSLVFNNWAFLKHPDWRIVPARPKTRKFNRYGICCPNNPDYRKFALSQINEIMGSYKFNGFFFDMAFWPAICLCKHCREKFRKETGKNIPVKINWLDPLWCKFQSMREDWMCGFIRDVAGLIKNKNRSVSIYFNFATAFLNWSYGLPLRSAKYHDFLGGDFYGDSIEQLLVSKIMINLTENMPVEFATTLNVSLNDHVRLKNPEEIEIQAFASTLFSSAFLFIDAVDPEGSINGPNYGIIRNIYNKMKVYEPYLGGKPVEDVAIYFSDNSKMDFKENGLDIEKAPRTGRYPHIQAVRGACRLLQKSHIPFGIITRKQINSLKNYKAVVLPNLLRMDKEETDAFRRYVKEGGSIYASRMTSLTDDKGKRYDDFMLSDVFGCSFENENAGKMVYLKPVEKGMKKTVLPQKYVSHFTMGNDPDLGTVLLKKKPKGNVLAGLTLSFNNKTDGCVFDKKWASIHSWPPWNDTKNPVIIRNKYGKGEVIYSASDIESVESDVNYRLFTGLIDSLLKEKPSFASDTHQDVWISVFDQPENKRLIIGFLNYQSRLPAIPVNNMRFKIKPPKGKKFKKLLSLPGKKIVAYKIDKDGYLNAELEKLEVFKMLIAEYC